MRKLVVTALVITILTVLGYFAPLGSSKPATLSTGPVVTQAVEVEPKPVRILPRPEPTRERLVKRASRQRTNTHSDEHLTDSGVWYRLGQCESSDDPTANTGNGYYGLYQFDLPSWRAAGGKGYPYNATRAEQTKRGKIWKEKTGWYSWPACARKLGLL